MRYTVIASALLGVALFMGGSAQLAWAQESAGHAHDQAEQHGGQATMTEEFHFEVLFHRDSIQLYLYDGNQQPISTQGVSGSVTLSFREPGRKALTADLAYVKGSEEETGEHGHAEEGHHPQDFLQAKVDLAKVQEESLKAVFALKNLPAKQEKEITFRETFKLARLLEYVCPMKDSDPADQPGKCTKCGMTLQRSAYVYQCSMHPKVVSQIKGDKCWVCGMNLARAEAHEEMSGEQHKEMSMSGEQHDEEEHHH